MKGGLAHRVHGSSMHAQQAWAQVVTELRFEPLTNRAEKTLTLTYCGRRNLLIYDLKNPGDWSKCEELKRRLRTARAYEGSYFNKVLTCALFNGSNCLTRHPAQSRL